MDWGEWFRSQFYVNGHFNAIQALLLFGYVVLAVEKIYGWGKAYRQRKLAKEEERRAELEITHKEPNHITRVYVRNTSETVAAKDVRIYIDGIEDGNRAMRLSGASYGVIPIIPPQHTESREFYFVGSPPSNLTVRWQDDSGEPRETTIPYII